MSGMKEKKKTEKAFLWKWIKLMVGFNNLIGLQVLGFPPKHKFHLLKWVLGSLILSSKPQ